MQKMLASLWLGLLVLSSGANSNAYREPTCRHQSYPQARLAGTLGPTEQTVRMSVAENFCLNTQPFQHSVLQADLRTCARGRASASRCWLRPYASQVLAALHCRCVLCIAGVASDGAGPWGRSAVAGAGPDGHIGHPLPFRACVQAGPFVLATSGSLMKTSVAALPTACSSACPDGALPLISGLSEPPAGWGLLASEGHINSPVQAAVLSAPAAWCKIRLRWGPHLPNAAAACNLKCARAGVFVFRHPLMPQGKLAGSQPGYFCKAFFSSWPTIANSAVVATRRCPPPCSPPGVALVHPQYASNCCCCLFQLRPVLLGAMLPRRHQDLRMLCMVRAPWPRPLLLCSALAALPLLRQQQDTEADAAIGLPCMSPLLGHRALFRDPFARTLAPVLQPVMEMVKFLAASCPKASPQGLLPPLCHWLPFSDNRQHAGCGGPACDGLRWAALLQGITSILVWRLRGVCRTRHMMHRLCVGKYRRRRLQGGDVRDWRKTLVRKRARCHSQHWALPCMLYAVCHWAQKGLQLICCVLLETFLRVLLCMRWASVLLSLPPKRLARALVGPSGLEPRQQQEHLPKHKLHHGGLPNRVLELNPGLRSRLGLVPRPKRRLPRSSPGAAVDPLDLTDSDSLENTSASTSSTTSSSSSASSSTARAPPAPVSFWSAEVSSAMSPCSCDSYEIEDRSKRRRSTAAPKMLVRAGYRCPSCFGLLRCCQPSCKGSEFNLRALRTHSWRFGCDLRRRAVLDQMAVASSLPLSLGVAVAVALHVCHMQCLCSCLCARLAQHSFRVFHSISSSISAGGLAQMVPVLSRLSIACARLAAPRGPVQGRLDLLTPLRFHNHHQSSRCAVTCHTGVSPAGPQSGTSSRMCLSPRWLGALLFMTLAFGARGARVAGGVATPAGAEQRLPAGTRQSAKHSDEQVSLSGPRKRAFRRAQNRATRDGATWYRGRWLTRQQLQAADGRTLRAKAARPAAAPPNAHKHARTVGRLAAWPPEPSLATGSTFRKGSHQLSVFSLNIGSFTTEVYDEFCRWLELPSTLASIDVIFVQETWRGSSDYQLPGWSWIASGQKPLAGQGVAVLVNRQLADSAAIRFREVRVGRILHVQAPLRSDSQGRLLNLLCVYVPAKISESKQVYEKRAAVWHALDAVLQALPSRHVLCVAGDFNTDLLQDPPLVGTTYMHKGKARTAAQDQPLFQNLLRTHGLHALNTWSSQGTYADPHGPTSRVDFLLTRTLQAAGHRVAVQPQIRFASWRAGARHLPLLGLIDLKVWCRFRDRTPALPPIDQEALCRACRPGAELEMLRQAFLARQHLFTAELPPSQAEAELRTLCAEVFPLRRHRTIMLQWQQPEVGQDLQLTWQLRSRLKQLAGRWPHLSSVFRVWQHHARLVRRVKELKRNSRRRRREHWQQQLAEAEQAGQTRNPLKFFQVVQRLAPKRDQTRVQIRDKAGHILTPDQEDRALAEYWTGIYSSSRMARQPAILSNPVLLSPQELQDALRALKQRKAVARGMAPAAVWKALASPLAHYLSEVLGAMWQPGRLRIPAVWTQSDLHFLPKPQKTTKRPQDLRPIALQSAAAKAVTTVFKHRLSLSFLEAMRGIPQYAYTANRSTQEGIARVAAHCSMVRDLVKTQTLTVFDRYAGAKYTPCLGGAQLSIDLSKAFDLLPRQTLQALLADTDLSPDERQILLEWHQAGQYRIQGRGSEKSVYVQLDCGVRQGCVLSPSLWGLFTKCIQQRLDAANGAGWTAQRGTMFADDLHFQWVFHTEGELSRVRAEVLAIFRTLRDLGMKANPEKSKFLISARGQQARKWIKRWIRKDAEGQRQFHFGGGRTDRVPVATQFAYLGTILSYRNFELETARHRLGVATGHRDRLRKVLHARRVLSVGHRLRLWRIMVQTSQLYALEAVGITPEVAKLLHVQTMRHLRAIIGSARHIDGDSDQLFMLKHGLPDCVELVKARCDIFCRRLAQEGLAVPCFGPLQSGSGRSMSGVPCLRRTLPSNGQALNPLCSLRLWCLLHLPMSRLSL